VRACLAEHAVAGGAEDGEEILVLAELGEVAREDDLAAGSRSRHLLEALHRAPERLGFGGGLCGEDPHGGVGIAEKARLSGSCDLGDEIGTIG
jgi:hypothetical protein